MIELTFFLLFATGIFTLSLPEMGDLYRLIRYKLKYMLKSFRNQEDWIDARAQRLEQRPLEYLRRLLQSTLSLGTRRSVFLFLVLSGLLFCGILLITVLQTPLLLAVTAAFAAALMPYLVLLCKLRTQRIESSQEGEVLVTELLNHYKIYYYNMQKAVEVTAVTIEEAPNSRRLLLNLAKGLNKASSDKDIRLLLSEFRFEIGTVWAGILAEDMYLACSSGIKVTEALSDLVRSMKQARRLEEYAGRENNEARWILKYFIPAGWLFTWIGGTYLFQASIEQYLYYQFLTETGMTWFLLWFLFYMMAWLTRRVLARRKLDI